MQLGAAASLILTKPAYAPDSTHDILSKPAYAPDTLKDTLGLEGIQPRQPLKAFVGPHNQGAALCLADKCTAC